MLTNKLTIEEMQQIAQERGGLCLSSSYVDCQTALEWQCADGHRWKARPAGVKKGSWCPACAFNRSRKDLEDLIAIAQQHGGKCLSTHYSSGDKPLRWRCAEGHTWKATGQSVRKGSWCQLCYYASKRSSLEEMQALAQSKGGTCLAEVYIDGRIPLEWQCEKGHRWKSRPDAIHTSWCPECSFERKRLGIAKMQEIAALRGGRCVSKHYKNCNIPLTWQCNEGHVWEAKPIYVTRGQWCPDCRKEHLNKQKALSKQKKKQGLSTPILV